jgi:succinate dehydrogenase / fumarate reductase, cytochrome b subunit
MKKPIALLSSTIGRKLIMMATGLLLCSFLLVHLAGNLLLFKGDGGVAFTAYARFMSSAVLIRVLEVGLVLGFLFHIVDAALLTKWNRAARPDPYEAARTKGPRGWTARYMGFSGGVLLVFLLIHLRTFLVEHRVLGNPASLYDLVVAAFRDPRYVSLYVGAMVLLACHLHHGFQSAVQTLGVTHRRARAVLNAVGVLFSLVVPAGFASIPLYFHFVR